MLKHSAELRDYKGQKLCEPCWNNQHYRHDGPVEQKRGKYVHKGKLVSNCNNTKLEEELSNLRREANGNLTKRRLDEIEKRTQQLETVLNETPCQCACRQLLSEATPRIKRDLSLQVPMFGSVAEVVRHRDEG